MEKLKSHPYFNGLNFASLQAPASEMEQWFSASSRKSSMLSSRAEEISMHIQKLQRADSPLLDDPEDQEDDEEEKKEADDFPLPTFAS